MAQTGPNKKIANSLVAMSSAAVLAVYAAGYTRTRSAASQIEAQAAERRPAPPGPPRTAPELQPASPATPASEPSTVATVAPAPAPEAASKPVPIAPAEPHPTTAVVPPQPAVPSPVEASPAAAPVAAPVAVAAPAPAATPVPPVAEHKAEEPAAPPAPVAPAPPAPKWKDGTYLGWGTSRHGDIQASVVIEGGHIASATIAQCWTRYSCSVISQLPPQVAQRQSPEVDFVSGATQSANAFYYGVVDALNKAK